MLTTEQNWTQLNNIKNILKMHQSKMGCLSEGIFFLNAPLGFQSIYTIVIYYTEHVMCDAISTRVVAVGFLTQHSGFLSLLSLYSI